MVSSKGVLFRLHKTDFLSVIEAGKLPCQLPDMILQNYQIHCEELLDNRVCALRLDCHCQETLNNIWVHRFRYEMLHVQSVYAINFTL